MLCGMNASILAAYATPFCILVASASANDALHSKGSINSDPSPEVSIAKDGELEPGFGIEAFGAAAPHDTTKAPGPPLRPRDESWKLEASLELPDWLTLKGHQRTRYESFDEQFRAGRSGSAQGIFTRTALQATARVDDYEGSIEVIDSRQFDIPSDLPLNTGIVNTLDILQAYVGTSLTDVWSSGDELSLTLGRHTMNIGSRRLVARNRFRNTINNFTGFNGLWESEGGDTLRAFYVIPVQRLPRGAQDLRDNEQDFDEERSQVQFFGVHGEKQELIGAASGELYAFGIDEEDGRSLNTRNRQLWTLGFRIAKAPKAGEFDFDLEAAYQTGDARASSSSADTTDLDHEAEFVHVSAAYRWDTPLQTRLEFLFDYASGDADPNDGNSNRFDTLFGARRFEYGPTGIFGAFARANIITPGLRLNLKPTENTQLMIADRFHYLASNQDAWSTSGLVDATGNSGDYIGNLAEFRLRWDPHTNLRVEGGVAHLFAGSFIDNAPNATTQGDTTYGYIQTVLSF